jgi:hypothetical protein
MTHHDDGNGLGVLLHRAVDEEPALGFTADQHVARGRRARRVRNALAGLSTVATVAAIALVAVTVRGPGGGDGDAATIGTAAGPLGTGPAATNPLTQQTLVATLQDELGATFRTVTVHERMHMPSGNPALDLYGSIADPTGDTAFFFGMVGVEPDSDGYQPSPGPRLLPDCDGSDFTIGNDGPPEHAYVGTCTSQTLANGTVVIWRSGRTPDGYARSAAILGRPDGSGMFVESTNQAIVDPSTCIENSSGKHCPIAPIMRTDPGVTAQALGDLLVTLEPATR